MQTIEFKNGQTAASAETMEAFQGNIRDSVENDTLFENLEEGTQSPITLSKDKSIYKYLRITYSAEYESLDTAYETKIIPVLKEDQKSALNSFYTGSVYMYILNTQITLSGNQITFYGNRILRIGANSYTLLNTPTIKILKVEGIKE